MNTQSQGISSISLMLFILAPALAIACILGYRAARKYFFADNFGVVEDGKIYRSGQLYPRRLEKIIAKHGIRTILHGHVPELSEQDANRFTSVIAEHGVKLVQILMPGDGRGNFEQYDEALAILRDRDNLPALVCCARGTHRTGAMVAAYRVLEQGWDGEDALKEMEQYRFRPRPHRYKGSEHPLVPHLREYFRVRTGGAGVRD